MTRPEAFLALYGLVRGLPGDTFEERAAVAAERLAAHEDADVLRALLVERALAQLVEHGALPREGRR